VKKGLNFGEKCFKKILYALRFELRTLNKTISVIQHMNDLRVLFILCAANNNCDDSNADKSCFSTIVALNPMHHLLTPQIT